MNKDEIIQKFMLNDYPIDSLYFLLKQSINFTEEHLQEPIKEVVFRHIHKDAKQLANAIKCKYDVAVGKILELRKC